MATISDERLAEMSSQLGRHIAGADWWPDNFECKPDELYSILTELQSLRSQAGVSEAGCEAALDGALKFVQPKLQAIKTEKGLIGVFCQAWRMAWKARPSPIEITEELLDSLMGAVSRCSMHTTHEAAARLRVEMARSLAVHLAKSQQEGETE